jgi:excisionase family DNA binding protein
MKIQHDILKTREVAQLLGVSQHAVIYWCKTGQLRFVQLGYSKHYMIQKNDLLIFLELKLTRYHRGRMRKFLQVLLANYAV